MTIRSDKVEEAAWLIRTMTGAELVELRERLGGDDWLQPPDSGVREPRSPSPADGVDEAEVEAPT